MTSEHALEWVFLVTSLLALCAAMALFMLKIGDFLRVRKAKQNGPLLFMVTDNLRRQGVTLAVCGGLLMLAVSGINNQTPMTSQALNLVTGSVLFSVALTVEAVFIYRRREKMALLVAIYEQASVPGGRRCTDPPATEGEP